MEIKLISLIRYTTYQSLLDEGNYPTIQTAGDRLTIKQLLEEQ